jgi:hypothetical protein
VRLRPAARRDRRRPPEPDRLTGDNTVTLQTHQEQPFAPERLTGVLDQPRSEVWTGVTFARMESLEWMYLWLTCALPGVRRPSQTTHRGDSR